MSSLKKRKAAEARMNVARVSKLIRRRVARLEQLRAKAVRQFENAEESSEEQDRISKHIRDIDEKAHRHFLSLERINSVSERDRVLERFQLGRGHRLLATQVDEDAGVDNLSRTIRLLVSLKRSGVLGSEVVSEVVDGRRVQRRWWWRVK